MNASAFFKLQKNGLGVPEYFLLVKKRCGQAVPTVLAIGIHIGLIAQSCFLNSALATPFDISPAPDTQKQRAYLLLEEQLASDAERTSPNRVNGQLLAAPNSSSIPRSYPELDQQTANRSDQKYPEISYSYSDSVTLKDVPKRYSDTGENELNQHQGSYRVNENDQGPSIDPIKDLLDISLDDEQVAMLKSVIDPWKETWVEPFSFFDAGNVVAERALENNHAASRAAPGYAHQTARNHGGGTVTTRQGGPGYQAEQMTLERFLHEIIDSTIGWPLFYLLITMLSIWTLAAGLISLIKKPR